MALLRNANTLWSITVGITAEALSTAYRIAPRAENPTPDQLVGAEFDLFATLIQSGAGASAITWQTSPNGTTGWTDLPITGLSLAAAGTDYAQQAITPMEWIRRRITPSGGASVTGTVYLAASLPFSLATA